MGAGGLRSVCLGCRPRRSSGLSRWFPCADLRVPAWQVVGPQPRWVREPCRGAGPVWRWCGGVCAGPPPPPRSHLRVPTAVGPPAPAWAPSSETGPLGREHSPTAPPAAPVLMQTQPELRTGGGLQGRGPTFSAGARPASQPLPAPNWRLELWPRGARTPGPRPRRRFRRPVCRPLSAGWILAVRWGPRRVPVSDVGLTGPLSLSPSSARPGRRATCGLHTAAGTSTRFGTLARMFAHRSVKRAVTPAGTGSPPACGVRRARGAHSERSSASGRRLPVCRLPHPNVAGLETSPRAGRPGAQAQKWSPRGIPPPPAPEATLRRHVETLEDPHGIRGRSPHGVKTVLNLRSPFGHWSVFSNKCVLCCLSFENLAMKSQYLQHQKFWHKFSNMRR